MDVEQKSAVISSALETADAVDFGSLLLSIYQCLTEPDHFRDMTVMLTSWLESEADPVQIVRFETHASELWEKLGEVFVADRDTFQKADVAISLGATAFGNDQLGDYFDLMDVEDVARVKHWIKEGFETEPLMLVRLYTEEPPSPRVACLRFLAEGQGGLFLTNDEFEDTVTQLFETNFSLSSREVQVLKKLVRGQTPKEIAASEGKSWETVRSQIKSITSKLGVSGQTDVIRMAAEAMTVKPKSSKGNSSSFENAIDGTRSLILRDGRRLDYEVDNPGKSTVLLNFHCLTSGRHWSRRARSMAEQADLSTVRVSRAAFGKSSINPALSAQLLADHVQDYAEVVRTEKINRCVLFAVGMGFPSAFRFAVLYPEWVAGIVGLDAPPPVLSKKDTKYLKGVFKAGALANLYAPTSAKLIANFAFRHLSKRNGIDLNDPLAMPGFDLTKFEDEDGCEAFIKNNSDSMRNKGVGYWREASYATVDWAELPFNANNRPNVRLIQSRNSPFVAHGAADQLAERIGAKVRTIDSFLPMISGPFDQIAEEISALRSFA